MNNLQLRTQLRATLNQYISTLMENNQISASMMEDALNYVIIQIKDAAMVEYAQWAIEDKQSAIDELQSPTEIYEEIDELPQVEEVNEN